MKTVTLHKQFIGKESTLFKIVRYFGGSLRKKKNNASSGDLF